MKKENIIEAMKTIPHFCIKLSEKTGRCKAYISQVKSGSKKMPDSWLPFSEEVIKEMYEQLDKVSGRRRRK